MPRPMKELTEVEHHTATLFASLELSQTSWLVTSLIMHDPPRILIVDDNETNRDILVTRLARQGYDLCQAADGEAALAAAKTLLPDLILLDVMMPKLNGIEVCRRLKNDPALPFMAIILVTAKADTKDIVVGLDAGADEYLTKPVNQAALVARVRSVLRLTRLHQLRGVGDAKVLKSLGRSPKGRHYRG
jgi:DNA-binding response OmpR family regulator